MAKRHTSRAEAGDADSLQGRLASPAGLGLAAVATFLLALVSAGVFVWLATDVMAGEVWEVDTGLRSCAYGQSSPAMTFLMRAIGEVFDLTPRGIMKALDLRKPIYRPTAAYGHFGRDDRDFTWERTDKAKALAAAAR